MTIVIHIDGRAVTAEAGRPLGAILHRETNAVLRETPKSHAPRGLFCGMGVCFDCLVTIDGRANVRACVTPVRDGMRVETRRS
ncbi:(2Fe-2S)-binding protein [Kaistia dalseonensis]|uniref:Molibdopterin-dependent oxidoreductase YjgC n=1 Tax=Kaistia dalseonensis TaxID=410840 RepID=A0ABU0HAH7_9HYPH|nr:(2Fe-2S)-binding protein [Kaistia dalseonensis]MCX5496699.1 (2Fe-2S)-binding protein [Kaistia dalseonensis]MDQ0439325.1 putative molibdopterin-dependent oxidoreductase YjgC [Kaistia dalseonensis]